MKSIGSIAVMVVYLLTGTAPSDSPGGSLRYLSDTDEDYRYIETEQKQAYESAQAAFKLHDLKQTELELKRAKETLRFPGPPSQTDSIYKSLLQQLHETLPTRYEDPAAFYVLRKQVNQIVPAALDLHLPPTSPKFGTLPTNVIQGQTAIVPATKHKIVLLNTLLFAACTILSKPVVQTVEIDRSGGYYYSPDVARARIKQNRDLRLQLLQFILEYVGKASPIRKYNFDTQYAPLLTTMFDAMELFAVAHEYGHIIKNHDQIDTDSLKTPWGKTDVTVLKRSWHQELEADDVGAIIMIKALEKDPNPLHQAFLGTEQRAPLLFFKYAEFLDDARYVLTHGTVRPPLSRDQKGVVSQTMKEWRHGGASKNPEPGRAGRPSVDLGDFDDHPPAELRRQALLRRINDATNRLNGADGKKGAELEEAFERNMDLLFESLVPDLVRVYNGDDVLEVFGPPPSHGPRRPSR